jgi:hypothetical protein
MGDFPWSHYPPEAVIRVSKQPERPHALVLELCKSPLKKGHQFQEEIDYRRATWRVSRALQRQLSKRSARGL